MTVRRIPGVSPNPDLQAIQISTDVSREESLLQPNPEPHKGDIIDGSAATPNAYQKAVDEASVLRQFEMFGVDNPTVSQMERAVQAAHDPALQHQLQLESAVAKQLELAGVENITKEQIAAGVKLAQDPEAQKRILQQMENNPNGTLGDLLKDVINTPGGTPWSGFDPIKDVLKPQEGDNNESWSPPGSVPQDKPSGPGDGSPSSEKNTGENLSAPPLVSADTQTYSAPPLLQADVTTWHKGPDTGGQWEPGTGQAVSVTDNFASSTTEYYGFLIPNSNEAKSDPSEWAGYPGSSGGSAPGAGTTGGSTGTTGGSTGSTGSSSNTQGTDNSKSSDDTKKSDDSQDGYKLTEADADESEKNSGSSGYTNDFDDSGIPSLLNNPLVHLPGGVNVGGGDSMDTGDGDPSNDSTPGVQPGTGSTSSTASTNDKNNTGPTKPTLGPYMGDNDTVVNPRANSALENFEADINDYTPPNETGSKEVIE